MSNIKETDDNLTVSHLYNTLKSPIFLKQLYWDILSGIKEKNTYKFMRELAEGVIDKKMKEIDGLVSTDEDTIHRNNVVAQISVMSYAIDTVFSRILYRKLEKACKDQIVRVIHELRQEGKIPENVWSRINLNGEASGSQESNENELAETNSIQVHKEAQRFPTRVGKRRRTATSKLQDIARANANKEILDDIAKVNLKYTNEDENIKSDNTKRNSPKKSLDVGKKESPKKNIPTRYPTVSLNKVNVSMLQNSVDDITSKDFFESDNEDDSDSDSDISIGGESVVSSVHTSDLSSFDDEISLSSDDEKGQKKKVPLKEVQKKFSQGNDSRANEKNDVKSSKASESEERPIETATGDKNKIKKISTDDAAKSTNQFPLTETSGENGLSKRTRKPNSRYSSANILCPTVKVKERKKPIKTYSKMSNDELSPPSKKTKVDDICGDVVTITKTNETSSNIKTPVKQPETVDLFKSHSANRSLTSRRTAPVTLFST